MELKPDFYTVETIGAHGDVNTRAVPKVQATPRDGGRDSQSTFSLSCAKTFVSFASVFSISSVSHLSTGMPGSDGWSVGPSQMQGFGLIARLEPVRPANWEPRRPDQVPPRTGTDFRVDPLCLFNAQEAEVYCPPRRRNRPVSFLDQCSSRSARFGRTQWEIARFRPGARCPQARLRCSSLTHCEPPHFQIGCVPDRLVFAGSVGVKPSGKRITM
jgi:hypothetical protein